MASASSRTTPSRTGREDGQDAEEARATTRSTRMMFPRICSQLAAIPRNRLNAKPQVGKGNMKRGSGEERSGVVRYGVSGQASAVATTQ